MVVMVAYISEQKLLILLKPNTLQEAITETQDMEDTFPNNTSEKKNIPPKG
jgi:hypothetical protein